MKKITDVLSQKKLNNGDIAFIKYDWHMYVYYKDTEEICCLGAIENNAEFEVHCAELNSIRLVEE